MKLRSRYDREILRLAVPALGALAAEPLYLLADTAMVGHLGTEELAALAIAATLLAGSFTLFNFLTYGTTAQVARYAGAGDEVGAGRIAAQSLWLSTAIGVMLTALLAGLAVPLVDLMGGHGRVGELAVDYLRIGSLGLPFALIALAGQGYLRGVSDLRTPLVIVVVANAANVVLNGCTRRSSWRARCWRGSARTRSAPTRSRSSCSCSWRWCSTRSRSRGR